MMPEDMKRIRKQLKLTQQQMADLIGIGREGVSRYEIGRTQPPLSVEKMLFMIDNHPEVVEYLRE